MEEGDQIETVDPVINLPPGGIYKLATSGPCDPQQEEFAALKGEDGNHKLSVGGEHIPHTPLPCPLIVITATGATLALFCGAVIISLGVVLSGLISFHGTRSAPPIWSIGILPFVLGIAGVHFIAKKSRQQVYGWGLFLLLASLTETIIIWWAGIFYTSNYDVWPPHKITDSDDSVCHKWPEQTMCYCQNSYQGIQSTITLPNIKYITINNTVWRETMFDDCGMVHVISRIYFATLTVWAFYIFSVIITSIGTHAGSVCVKHNDGKFELLEEDVESHLAAVEEDEDSHRWQDENEASKMADPSETVAVVHTGLPKEDEGSANEDGRY